jgi:hypothetical protein
MWKNFSVKKIVQEMNFLNLIIFQKINVTSSKLSKFWGEKACGVEVGTPDLVVEENLFFRTKI